MKSRKPIQLIIPEPCQQKWDEMHVRNEGRFCDYCQKTVIDFTKFTDKDLYVFFDKHQNEKVCGRFLNTQLNREIQLPYQPHSTLYRIAVALGLVLSFSQIPEMQARWRAPLVMENSIGEMMKEDEKVEGDSLVVRGRVVDERGEPIIGAIIEVGQNGIVLNGALTDEEGLFRIELKMSVDSIDMRVRYTGYKEIRKKLHKSDYARFQEIKMDVNTEFEELIILGYRVPLIKTDVVSPTKNKIEIECTNELKSNPSIDQPSSTTISGEQINRMP